MQYYCQASIDEGEEENTWRIQRGFRRCKLVAIICYTYSILTLIKSCLYLIYLGVYVVGFANN
jgi:hypothetical protein